MLDVKIGDRVCLTHKNGDTAEVTLIRVESYAVESTCNYFAERDGWTVTEVLPKPAPQEPKGLGAAVQYEYKYGSGSTAKTTVVRTPGGDWADVDGDFYSWTTLVNMADPDTITVLSQGYVAAD